MKKILVIICTLALLFSLSACGKGSAGNSEKESASPFATAEKPEGSIGLDRKADESKVQEAKKEAEPEAPEPETKEKEADSEATEEEVGESEIDLSAAFGDINGCAVIYLPVEDQYWFFHEEMCRQEISPYSTFKIISALSGLQNGVILDELSTMEYDGTVYGNPEWNDDLTLEQAFRKSCVWYFRQVIDAVGKDEIQKELNELQYGNCDISQWNGSDINPLPELNGFWLDSSLKISPLEQVKVLEDIFEGQSDYDSDNIETLKRIMLTDENDAQKIYGKTGSSGKGEAWFVGFAETTGGRKYFAVYLDDSEQKEQVSGSKAKEIALKILF